MNKQKEQPLLALMHSLAADSVNLQRTFDARNEATLHQYQQACTQIDEPIRSLLPAPAQMLVSEFEASARVEWTSEVTRKASLAVTLPNLSADIRYGRQASNDSRFQVHVQRVPLGPNASNTSSSQT